MTVPVFSHHSGPETVTAMPDATVTSPPPSVRVPPMGSVKGVNPGARYSPTAKVAIPAVNVSSDPTNVVNHMLLPV